MDEKRVARREFLKRTSVSIAALGAAEAAMAHGAAASKFETIHLPPGCPLPLRTAADELADRTGAAVVVAPHRAAVGPREIVLAVGSDAAAYRNAFASLPNPLKHREWELVARSNDGLLIAGSSARNACRAALAWLENPADEVNRVSLFRFEQRWTMWDNGLNQLYRFAKGFDRQRHVRQIALTGHTAIEINRYADTGGYHVRHRKFPHDSYAWYLSYAPALDAFVESSLTKGLYPPEELATNLADLREAAQLARRYGLKPGFVCYEPRSVPEAIFDRYPQLRGSRTDHPGRSLTPRYALDIANPKVLAHYAELMTNLMQEVPDLRYLVFWTQDSGSGLPFARRLYFGPNGSYLARSKTLEQMAADFSGMLLEAGRKINPTFEVVMKVGWEYAEEERKRITAALPRGVTLSHHFGGNLMRAGDFGGGPTYVADDRAAGIEPHVAITVSTMWDEAPVFGVPGPWTLAKKFAHLRKLKLQRLVSMGAVLSPPQCPWNINQTLYTELLRGEVPDLERFLLNTARRWCEGDARQAVQLVEAWRMGDQVLAEWPKISWYDAGAGQTQGRWLTRPLVPDITRLDQRERAAWERCLFTLPWDIARQNVSFEGGIRLYEDADLNRAVRGYDQRTLPGLARAVEILGPPPTVEAKPVVRDQRDRYQGLLLLATTVRNLFAAQAAINACLLEQENEARHRRRLQQAIEAEIENTQAWLRLLKESKTIFFRTAQREETPFLYKTPIEDLALKLEVMKSHQHDEPGPQLAELREDHSEKRLLFY